MIKKILILLFSVLLLFPITTYALELDINSKNAILYNLNDDTILYEKNSDEKVSIASLTKIMTAIVTLESIEDIDSKVKMSYKDFEGLIEANAAVCGLKAGEEVTYRDLLYCIMLPSGADGAQAISRTVAGSNEEFVKKMNDKAKELGLNNTHFVNTTGLDIENHYSTVKDVSTMLKYAIKNENFLEIIKSRTYTMSNGRLTFTSTIKKNLDLFHLNMDYLIGGKTGSTNDGGLCFASIANYNNVNYMLVTVRAPYSKKTPYNFLDAKTIYEYFMNNYSYKNIVNEEDVLVTLKTKYAKNDEVKIYSSKSIDKYLKNNFKKEDLKYKYNGDEIITLSMDKGTKLGNVEIYLDDELLDTVDVYLDEKQNLDIIKYLKGNIHIVIITIVLIIFGIFLLAKMKRNAKRKKFKKKLKKWYN